MMKLMKNKKFLVLTSLIVIFSVFVTGCASKPAAPADPSAPAAVGGTTFEDAKIKWVMQSAWAPSITLWRGDKYFVDSINRLALGDLFIEYNVGGALVTSVEELFDAISTGSIDMGTDWPSYWEGKDTAFGLVTSTPMLLTPGDYMVWYWQAGGFELVQELYAKFNIVWYPHSVTAPESGQRTNVPIVELDDYAGLKLRQCGRAQAKILEDLGAGAVFLPGADVYLSVDRGVVDGAEFSVPEVDWSMALNEVTKFSVVPGWHQPGPISGLMINKDSFDALPDHTKYAFKEASLSTMLWTWTFFEYSSAIYQNKFVEGGATISRLSDDALSKIQKVSWDMLLQDAKDNPNHARVAFSQVKYLKDYSGWRADQAPFTFGRNPEGLDDVYSQMEKIAKDHGVYDDVIAASDNAFTRAKDQMHWEPGTPYTQNPLAK